MSDWLERIGKIRSWIDGEGLVSENAPPTPNPAQQYESESFLANILTEIDEVLRREMIRSPSGETFIPSSFAVFVSPLDDRSLTPEKRAFLETDLARLIVKRATEKSLHSKLTTQSVNVKIEVNQFLGAGEIDIETSTPSAPQNAQIIESEEFEPETVVREAETVVVPVGIETVVADTENTPEKLRVLYQIEVRQADKLIGTTPVFAARVVVGRTAEGGLSDVLLPDDEAVSRIHAEIFSNLDQRLWLTAKGKNPTKLRGVEVSNETPTLVKFGDEIGIGSYILQVKPPDTK